MAFQSNKRYWFRKMNEFEYGGEKDAKTKIKNCLFESTDKWFFASG